MDKFRWTSRIEDQPLDICKVTPWHGDGGSGAFNCETCGKEGLSSSYEVIAEWGDTKVYENELGFLCRACLVLMMSMSRNAKNNTVEDLTRPRSDF